MSNIKFGLRTRKGLIRPIIESSDYDIDARAYFAANTAITSPLDKRAISDFYGGLKSDGIYTKIKAMYLPIWGSAASSKWNLINPLDTNAAYRLTFSTGWTYSSSGITPNGTSAYADTFFVPSSNLTLYNGHASCYSRTSTFKTGTFYVLGTYHGSTQALGIWATSSTSSFSGLQYSNAVATDYTTSTVLPNKQGFIINSRTSITATSLKLFRNGIANTNAITSTPGQTRPTTSIYLGAVRDVAGGGSPAFYDNGQMAFYSIGDGLTDTEAANFSSRVNTLMTYFGINVY